MQIKLFFTVLAALVPLATSTFTSKDCKNNEFWWPSKGCCLPKGGPPSPPEPPKDTKCPPTSYYWGSKQGCCVPRNPPPSNPPPPQCPKKWNWYPAIQKCLPTPTPPTPPPSNPSHKPGGGYGNWGNKNGNGHGHDNGRGNGGNYHGKRDLKSRASLCPTGLDACPVSGLAADYECIDVATELESCGGCTSLNKGQDCTKIQGAWNVGCDQGSCVVYSCAGGFQIGADGKSCIPL